MKGNKENDLGLLQPVLLSSRCLHCLPQQQQREHVIAIEGHRVARLRTSLEKHVGDNDGAQGGGGGEESRSLGAGGGLLSSSAAANSITAHMCKHLRYLLV